jgi:predicted porin
VLLRPGRLRIEPTFSYSRSDRSRILFDGIDLIDVVFIGQIYSDQIRNETFSSSVTFRYGASDRLNLRATIPWEYRKTELFPIERDQAPISALQTRENSSVGDISLGLSYQVHRSDTRLPSVVANMTYSPDTGDPPYTGRGYKRLTGGLTFLTQSDPAVLFGSLSYLHNEGDYKGFERGDFVGGSFGYSYALNYDLSISTSLSYLRQIEDSTVRRPQGGRLTLGRRETDATLSLGLTYALTRRTALALSVGIGLTDESPELTLSMSLPMAFNTSGWW